MSGKTATSVNGRRHDQRPRLRQMDLFTAATVDSPSARPHGKSHRQRHNRC